MSPETTRFARGARAALLLSPAFVVAVLVLAVNDHLLKPAFGNWLTGKLSDVAGLFAFALFWCALVPGRRTATCLTTAVAWMAWKSPLADAPLAWWNALEVARVGRVVDYGDWLALLVLPIAWRHAGRAVGRGSRRLTQAWRRAGAVASALAAVLTFGATSVARPELAQFPDRPTWTFAASRAEVREVLASRGFTVTDESPRRATEDSTLASQLVEFRIGQTAGGDPVLVSIALHRMARDTTRIALLVARTARGTGRPQEAAILMLFEDTVIAPLRARFGPER